MIQNFFKILILIVAAFQLTMGDSPDSYKHQHEAFVSNLKGTSVGCILSCLAHAPALILMIKLVQKTSSPIFLRDMMYLVIPLLLSITILADYCFLSLLAIMFAQICFLQMQQTASIPSDKNLVTMLSGKSRKSFISLFKGSNVLITCLAILAVDFRIFPRRFAKTETFGLSLMDIGVGTFIISSAITSRYARGNVARNQTGGIAARAEWQVLQRVAVLLLGFGRMFVIKVLKYQEIVSEYGSNWNFFVTLFCVWTAADFLHQILPRNSLPWLAIITLIVYQALLSNTSLTDFILSAPRKNFLSSNREGLFSLLGFIPLYLLSESISYHLFFCRGIESQEDEEYWSRQWDEREVTFVREDAPAEQDAALVPTFMESKEQDRVDSYSDTVGDDGSLGRLEIKPALMGTVRRAGATGGSFDSRETGGGAIGSSISVGGVGSSHHGLQYGFGNGSGHEAHHQIELGGGGGGGSGVGAEDHGRLGGSLAAVAGGSGLGINMNSAGLVAGIAAGHTGGSASSSKVTTTRSRFINMFGGLFQWRVLIPPQSKRLVKQLSILLVVLWVSWIFASLNQNTSRRLTNLAFVLFTLAVSMTLILFIVIADVVGGPGVKVATLEYFNTWQLTIFMIANLMTGMVNMSMRTIYIMPTAAFFILAAYALAISGVVWLLSKLRQH